MHTAPTASSLIVLSAALVIDRAFGEYPALLHPVVWIGKAIGAARRIGSFGPCCRCGQVGREENENK